MIQGTQVAWESWKTQENELSSRIFRKEYSPVDTWILAQWDPC